MGFIKGGIIKGTRAAFDGRDGDTGEQPNLAVTGTRGGRSEIETGVEGELTGGLKAGTLSFVLFGFDFLGGSGGSNDFGVSAVLVAVGGLKTTTIEQIDGLR